MHLRVDREAISFQPLDQVHLPQRTVEVELVAVQTRHEHAELALAAGARQRRVAHVEVKVDVLDRLQQRQARAHQWGFERLEVPGRRQRARRAHALQLQL